MPGDLLNGRGKSRAEALTDAGEVRLRSIAMTTVGAELRIPAILDVDLGSQSTLPGAHATLFRAVGDSWVRVGGTTTSDRSLTARVHAEGVYAVFSVAAQEDEASLPAVSLTPRVLASPGAGSTGKVRIAFRLGRSASAKIQVFNRAGRLVRVVEPGLSLPAGDHVVRGTRGIRGEGPWREISTSSRSKPWERPRRERWRSRADRGLMGADAGPPGRRAPLVAPRSRLDATRSRVPQAVKP